VGFCTDQLLSQVVTFPIQNGLKQGDALSPLLFSFALDIPSGKSKKKKLAWN
jgi:hypothetical protein